MKYKIIYKKPFIKLFFLKIFFPTFNWEGTNAIMGDAFVFGYKIYTKDKLSYFQKAHELIHIQQQRGNFIGAVKWWYNYIRNSIFRLAQEAEAYRFEHQLFRKYVHDRNKIALHLDFCCRVLSGPLYKNLISYEEAKKFILKDGNNTG